MEHNLSPGQMLFLPDSFADPYPALRQLRQHDPVYWEESMHSWLITGYEAVTTAMRHPHASTLATAQKGQSDTDTDDMIQMKQKIGNCLGRWITFLDPPHHRPVRFVMNEGFRARVVTQLRDAIEERTAYLVNRQTEASFDLVGDIAQDLALWVVAQILGIPETDHHLALDWTHRTFLYMSDPTGSNQALVEDMNAVVQEATDYFTKHLQEREQTPSQDFLSVLLAAKNEGKMDLSSIIANCLLLFIAGQDTTVNGIGNAIAALYAFPEERARLQANPELVDRATEELLRFDPPTQFLLRTALDDFTLGNHTIRKGQRMMLFVAAANRDEAVFENPDQLNISRDPNPHISFGHGIHQCLGAPLARMEISSVLRQLCLKHPNWDLVGEMERKTFVGLRGFQTLRLKLEK